MWIFAAPSNDPYVKINLDFEFDKAFQFLDAYQQCSGTKISVHHFLVKVLADTLAVHPRLNVRVFGHDVYQLPAISIATPMNLINSEWSPKKNELALILIHEADKKSLEQIATEVSSRRKGQQKRQGTYLLEEISKFLAQYIPNFSLRMLLNGLSLFGHNPHLYAMSQDFIGISTVFTNVGSIIEQKPGIHYKAVSFELPDKLIHFSTCFAAGPCGPKPFVENDQVVIHKVLPFMIIFDHRVVDGFLMNRFLEDLGARIYNPEKYYALPNSKPKSAAGANASIVEQENKSSERAEAVSAATPCGTEPENKAGIPKSGC
jgi:hypothetical protein